MVIVIVYEIYIDFTVHT